jgi:hypothetical protein
MDTHEYDDASIVIPGSIILLRNEHIKDSLVPLFTLRQRRVVNTR